MKQKLTIILICVAVLPLQIHGQPDRQEVLDSLLRVWNNPAQADSIRTAAYVAYIWDGFLYYKPDSAFILAEALHDFAEKNNYPKAAAQGFGLQGISYDNQADYPLALDYHQRSVNIFEAINDKMGVGSAFFNIGSIYTAQGDYPPATEYLEKALAIYEKIRLPDGQVGDKKGIAATIGNMGIILKKQGNYPRALEYYRKSLEIREEINDKLGIATSLNEIGSVYLYQINYPRALKYYQSSLDISEKIDDKKGMANSLGNIGNIYFAQNETSLALEYYQKALTIYKEIDNKRGIGSILGSIGVIYNDHDTPALALEYYQKSLAIREEIGDKKGIAATLYNIGHWYLEHDEANRAIEYCRRSLNLGEEIGALDRQKAACNCLYDAYKALNKGLDALVYLEKMRLVEDSLDTKETTKKLEQMEFARVMLQDSIAKADEARLMREAHWAEVQQKNMTRNVLVGSSLLLLLLSGGFYSRWRYVRKSRAIISMERDRSENLLLNILPAEIAAELKQKGRADARDFELVSILFTDFKGFTEQSAKLSAVELVHEINHCFEAFDIIMEKYGIEKIKTIGDAYMAAGGIPVPSADSLKNTVLAAMEMQDFITKRKSSNDALSLAAFEMRVGIHTGPVVAGIVGFKKFQYDIWGDTVNTASRMESNGAVGKVNISQSTYELLKDDPDFEFESRGRIEAKGKGEIEMYFIQLKMKDANRSNLSVADTATA